MHDDHVRDSDRIDFSVLGPPLDADRLDALIAAAAARGSGELARRERGGGVVRLVVAWRRPLLAVSGLAAAAAIVLLLPRSHERDRRVRANITQSVGSIAEALGIPETYARIGGRKRTDRQEGRKAMTNAIRTIGRIEWQATLLLAVVFGAGAAVGAAIDHTRAIARRARRLRRRRDRARDGFRRTSSGWISRRMSTRKSKRFSTRSGRRSTR